MPTDADGPGGIRLGGLERRMRERWRTVNDLWELNRALANRLNLLGQLDYMGKLSAQLRWQSNDESRPVRLVYTSSGQPTAAVLKYDDDLVENVLFWVTCKDVHEANYLMAIINSDVLYRSVESLMPKGLFGARHLHKHLWRLPIPEFDAGDLLHQEVAEAGATAAAAVAKQLEKLRRRLEAEGKEFTVTIARRELSTWLRGSAEGQAVEGAVGRLLREGG